MKGRLAPLSYWAVVWFIRFCLRLYVRGPEVEGLENVPRDRGAILVSNHLNNADPCVIPAILRRRVITMAKKEMFKWPVVSLIFKFIGAFPVDRQGADLGALRQAQKVVNDGLLLLMFPEGTRSRDRQLHRGFAGTSLVAYRTGAPIIPIAITGTETIPWPWVFFRPFIGPRVTVRIGKPFYPPHAERITSQAAQAATEDLMLHIAELLPESNRGEYRAAVAARAAEDAGRRAAERV
ncbi:MAG: lysophospholipid acyltransferase family protein [Dehalococcoidia bacterium]